MSLMQLLSVGRSLCGIRDEPSRYKMTQDNLLPKFGSPKELGKNDAVQHPVRSARLDSAKHEMASSLGHEEAKLTHALAPEDKSGSQANSAPPVKRPKQAFPLGRWTLPKNPFAGKSALHEQAKGPVQCELSIDAVKVVRNDLSDADLEVIASLKPLAPLPAKKSRDGLESIALAWGRITARILGVGRTH
jgi:hypothetical protein